MTINENENNNSVYVACVCWHVVNIVHKNKEISIFSIYPSINLYYSILGSNVKTNLRFPNELKVQSIKYSDMNLC